MASLESFALGGSIITLILSLVISIVSLITGANKSQNLPANRQIWNKASFIFMLLAFLLLTLSLLFRGIQTGHGPFSNMYEFSLAFVWGIMLMSWLFNRRFKIPMVSILTMVIALILQCFALTLPSKIIPLMPALQQSYLLTAHVASAIIAYGTFTTGFAAAVLYLIQKSRKNSHIGNEDLLDEMSYRSVLIGFPFLTLLIILGAVWADIAWGTYWSWDPKETASLVTWLVYVAYLHARIMRRWRGSRAAILLIIGFAAVIFTFFGNYIFSGLHSYQ